MFNSFEKKGSGFITRGEIRSPKAQIVYWAMFLILAFVAFVCVFPILWVLVSGFKDLEEFNQVPPTIIPRSFDFSKIIWVWNDSKYYSYYLNSFIYALGAIACCLAFNGFAGFALSRLRPKGSNVLLKILFVLILLPAGIGQVPLYKQLVDLPYIHTSALNSYVPLWLMAGGSAYNIILFKNYFDSISDSIIEAARIDGCSSVRIFFNIMLPLAKPIFIVLAIFTFNGSWGGFFWPSLILNDKSIYTVAVKLYRDGSGFYTQDQYLLLLTLTIIPPIIIFIFFTKQIMTGFQSGGVKE